jgi:glycosyltransferase involved in cell wall biosynthesis
MPTLSIISAHLNAWDAMSRTVSALSEIREAHPAITIEHIIQDGGSQEPPPVSITSSAALLFSEPDKGIYDAINKGISRATGDLIWVLHAGDYCYPEAVHNIISFYSTCPTPWPILVGSTRFETPLGSYVGRDPAISLESLTKGVVPSHQATIIPRAYHEQHTYSLTYPLAADFNLLFRLYKEGVPITCTHDLFAFMAGGGASSQPRHQPQIRQDILQTLSSTLSPFQLHLTHARLLYRRLKHHAYSFLPHSVALKRFNRPRKAYLPTLSDSSNA